MYAPTTINGYGGNCLAQVGASVKPDNTGLFIYYLGNGTNLKIERNIKGNYNLPYWNIPTYKRSSTVPISIGFGDCQLFQKRTLAV
ncbi:MAG: hypothetical protein H7282_10475 [Cytophagaceae bacterium]|nr:hypothetical protein [Cytophagaceae bacterium]